MKKTTTITIKFDIIRLSLLCNHQKTAIFA
nr:MAG TPA: PROTEIN/DNA Complex I, vanadate complex, ISOMERASE-DNA.27A [Caudoviricetes sp.]